MPRRKITGTLPTIFQSQALPLPPTASHNNSSSSSLTARAGFDLNTYMAEIPARTFRYMACN
ncbi:uncharacterized, partial [Tachysurus ichikawai]